VHCSSQISIVKTICLQGYYDRLLANLGPDGNDENSLSEPDMQPASKKGRRSIATPGARRTRRSLKPHGECSRRSPSASEQPRRRSSSQPPQREIAPRDTLVRFRPCNVSGLSLDLALTSGTGAKTQR
jgi:hypothetical protein